MRRIGILVIAFTTLAACGTPTGTGAQPEFPTTTTFVPAPSDQATTTTSSLATTVTQAPATTVTTAANTTTTAAAPTATAPPAKIAVAPYFYIDEAGHPNRQGPFLAPVNREVAKTVAVARAAIEQLLAGPTSGETEGIPAISTAIPDGVRLLGLTISGEGIATVDLSGEFEADDDSAAVAQRIAQVVFTLSQFPTVSEVLFRQDNVAVEVQTGEGELVSRPVGIWDYLEFAAALHIESPTYGGQGGNPLHVLGFGAVFEAAFSYALTDDDGLIIAEGHEMTTNGTGWGGFDFTIDYEVDRQQVGALIVWTHSAENGERIDIREYPVVLIP